MRQKKFNAVKNRFDGFISEFAPVFNRKQRSHRCSQYVSGLILDGDRKSIEPMASRLGKVKPRSLQDFMVQNTWDYAELLRALRARVFNRSSHGGIFIVDDTALPKKGSQSVGVAPQYCGVLGKVANCQSVVSWHYVDEKAHYPINARLYLPKEWTKDKSRLDKTAAPKELRNFKTKWQIALELLDSMLLERRPECICFDAGYGEIPEFYQKLEERGLHFVGQIPGRLAFWPENLEVELSPSSKPHRGRPYRYPKTKNREIKPQRAELFAKGMESSRWQTLTSPSGEKLTVCALRVRQAITQAWKSPGSERWLILERLADGEMKYHLSNLPPETAIEKIMFYAKSRWKIEQGYQQLKEELGLDHYEGRTWVGLHHHIALTFMAFHFLMELSSMLKIDSNKLAIKKNSGSAGNTAYH